MNIYKKILIPALLYALPLVTFGQTYLNKTKGISTAARDIVIDILVPLAFTLALVYFFWGVAKYIKSEGDGKAEGKSVMMWGVVALFVISSIWGLVAFLQEEFGISRDAGQKKIPNVTK